MSAHETRRRSPAAKRAAQRWGLAQGARRWWARKPHAFKGWAGLPLYSKVGTWLIQTRSNTSYEIFNIKSDGFSAMSVTGHWNWIAFTRIGPGLDYHYSVANRVVRRMTAYLHDTLLSK